MYKALNLNAAFGAKGTGVADDTAAIQAALDYCEANGIGQLNFEPGSVYLVSSSLNLPAGNSGNVAQFVMEGNGCLVKTNTTSMTIFSRTVSALTDPQNGDYWSPVIRNFKLQGVAGSNGIVIHRTGYTLIENVEVNTFDKGIELVFALTSRLSLCNAKACERPFRVTSGDVPFSDGTYNNSSSNVTVLSQCRAQTSSVSAVPFYIEHSGNVRLENCVAEGSNCDVACHIDNITAGGYAGYRDVTIDGFWCEITTAMNKLLRIESFLSNVSIKNVILPYANLGGSCLFIDADGSTYNTFEFGRVSSWGRMLQANAPWFKEHTTPGSFNRWVFDDTWQDNTTVPDIDLRDATWWSGGIVPHYFGRPVTSVDQRTAWRNVDLNSMNSAWTALGTTPPTVAEGTFDGRDNVRKTTFTSAMSAGYSACRASYAADTVPIVLGQVFRPVVDVKLSRALTGGEVVNIYYTGSQGSSIIALNSTNSAAAAAGWTEYTIRSKPVTTNGNVRLTVYLNGAVGSDVDVEVSNPRLQVLGSENVISKSVQSHLQLLMYSTLKAGDTTPSVLDRSFVVTANTGATSISQFDDGVDGQLLTVLINDTNTTIVHNAATIKLSGAVNFAAAAGGMLTLIKRGTVWYEISRTSF